jgi:hypothetical protein
MGILGEDAHFFLRKMKPLLRSINQCSIQPLGVSFADDRSTQPFPLMRV